MGKHYSGSTAASNMTHGAGPAGSSKESDLLGPGPGKAAGRVKPDQENNPGGMKPPGAKGKMSVEDEGE